MMPDWVEKFKSPGTTVKKIGNNYYLYYATSRYSSEKPYPVSVQTYIGKITPEGIISDRVSISPQKTEPRLLGSLVNGLPPPLDVLIVLNIKGAWHYTKMDAEMIKKLRRLGLYDNGKVVFPDI